MKTNHGQLIVIDSKTGVNWINDLIGNADDLKSFKFDDEKNIYICSLETYEFWLKVIELIESGVDSETAIALVH